MQKSKETSEQRKEKIRARYKGVSKDELEFIPAKPVSRLNEDTSEKRVAAYCRVSTDDPNQTSSYELQRNHYEEYIKEHEGWIFVDVYADEGISGTSMQHRDNFNRLIKDCYDGKIDLIVTKSVSRFARNIVDCIKTVRELKNSKNQVGVFFETEHIYTLDGASEMMLAVLSAAAQEESHTKSEIMNISIEQRFSRGIFLTPELLGYDKDEDGNLIINEDEADTVKVIYYLYLNGFDLKEICEILEKCDRPTKLGNYTWSPTALRGIIENERHCGDVLARKTFTPNYLDHKSKKNRNDRNQYIQRDHHDAIVRREIFEAANRKAKSSSGKRKPLPLLKVIPSGALKGFVPVDRTWDGFTTSEYVAASESAYVGKDVRRVRKKKKGRTLDLRGYQRVRGEFFRSNDTPTVSFSGGKVKFNTACLKKFEDVEYVELLFNAVKKCLAIRPCDKSNPNAIQWGVFRKSKWQVRPKTCKGFSKSLFEMMEWNEKDGYKLFGNFHEEDGQKLLVFELGEPELQLKDIPVEPDEEYQNEMNKRPGVKKIMPSAWAFSYGQAVNDFESVKYMEQIHYSGEWDVLRPAEEVMGINLLTQSELDELLLEAKHIIERWAS